MWDSNKKLQKLLEDVALPRIKFMTVPLDDDYEAHVKLLIPPTVVHSSGKKYPLLIHTWVLWYFYVLGDLCEYYIWTVDHEKVFNKTISTLQHIEILSKSNKV